MLDTIPFNVSILSPHHITRKENIWSQRQNAYLNYAKNTNPDRVIFFIDARDITWGGCERNLIEEFLKMNKSVVFGAEAGCWPVSSNLCKKFPQLLHSLYTRNEWNKFMNCDLTCTASPDYKFLNGGFIGGRAKDLVKLFTKSTHEKWKGKNDQERFINIYLNYHKRLNYGLDTEGIFSVQMQRMKSTAFYIKNKKLYSKLLKKSVCFLHGNGDGKELVRYFQHKIESKRLHVRS